MNCLNELFKLPKHLKNQIRKLENVKTKLLKSKWSLVFNDTYSIFPINLHRGLQRPQSGPSVFNAAKVLCF